METTTEQPSEQPMACGKCHGTGQQAAPKPGTKGWEEMEWVACPACGGTGQKVLLQ